MKIEFDERFEERILNRGYEYYKNEAVQDVHEKDDAIVAKIVGSETYKVYVQIEDDELIEAGCNCPYAANHYCKHIAALLYYLEENNIDSCSKKYKNKRVELLNTIKKIDKKELENFLVDLLKDDENVYDKFRTKFGDIFTPLSLTEYRSRIKKAIRTSAGRDGFIDYKESRDYTREMYKITDEANRLVDNEYYDLAFDVASSILDTIPNTNIDDSNGSTGEVAYSCIKIIENILDKVLHDNEKLSMKILQYILHELQTEYLSNMV